MVYIQSSLLTVRSYQYIETQMRHDPLTGFLVVELLLLIFYLGMLGFFICLFGLKSAFPWMVRLNNYAKNKARNGKKVFAILGVVGIWFCCALWVVLLPLIPVIGGVIARKAS
jgi:hypothetical protein